MGLFKLPARSSRETDKKLISKSKSASSHVSSIKGGGGLLEKIATINAVVEREFGDLKDNFLIINNETDLENYITKAVQKNLLSIDTETDGLDTLSCKLAGVCLYVEGEKPAYVPLHHVSYITGLEVKDQICNDFMASQLTRLNNTRLIFHNAKFDIKVLKNTLGVDLSSCIYWDTFIGAFLLNENEPRSLKVLWNKYCNENKSNKNDYDSLFDGVAFTHIPIKTGYLYAAKDALITYELFKFQEQFLNENSEKCKKAKLEEVAKLFREVEIPLIQVVCEIENNGVSIDTDYADKLAVEYRQELEKFKVEFEDICDVWRQEIDSYKFKNPNHKLSDPINISSPTQLSVLLYEIVKVVSPDKKKPTGTGEEILSKLDTPFAKAILNYRGVAKLLSTYIEKLPKVIHPKTNKVHASFNQTGAVTGRFSSSDPNLQNIPAQDKKIRKMFVPSEGNYFISCDFSQQEPRVLAHFSKDANLIQAYKDEKDIYSFIGSFCFGVPYDQCKEKNSDGTLNPEGKRRRNSAKSIVLGIMYGREANSIADQLKISVKEAEGIIAKFNNAFPQVKNFVDETFNFARQNGYVTTVWGRKRRLPDMLLDEYEFKYIDGKSSNFDPLNFDDIDSYSDEVDEEIIAEYSSRLQKAISWKFKNAIFEHAKNNGIQITDNRSKIADATRQLVNSKIQGTSADMVKVAMVNLFNNEELREKGFKIVMQVHDEIICECPIENVWPVADLMSKIMIETAATKVSVPQKCDVEVTDRWYGNVINRV